MQRNSQPQTTIRFRPAERCDTVPLSGLLAELGYSVEATGLHERFLQIASREDHCQYVALADHTVIGWIHAFTALRLTAVPFVEIGGLVVSEAYRRRQVGEGLVQRVNQWAADQHLYHVRVRCQVKRTGSHQFYQAIGFTPKKEQRVFELVLG